MSWSDRVPVNAIILFVAAAFIIGGFFTLLIDGFNAPDWVIIMLFVIGAALFGYFMYRRQ